MNIRELKYLVALSEQRHFGKAAEICFVSQPALSMQIKKLEKYLDVQLIERTNKSVLLTEIGETIAERARDILNQIIELREAAKLSKDYYRGELKMGIIPTLAPYLLPNIIPTLSKSFPKLAVYLAEEQTACLVEKLRQGKLDSIVLASPIDEAEFTTINLFQEEFMLAVPKHHPLAKRKKVNQTELANTKLLLLEDGHGMWEESFTFYQMIKTSEFRSFRATSLETLRHMVATGVGITLIPKLACKANNSITYIPFTRPKPTRTIGMMWRASTAKKNLHEEIAKCIRKIVTRLNLRTLK